jgi:hypothetical protein
MRDVEEAIRALDERMKLLEDQQAVYRLVSSYGPAMDTGSGPECGSLWADDGVYEYDDKRAHGPVVSPRWPKPTSSSNSSARAART